MCKNSECTEKKSRCQMYNEKNKNTRVDNRRKNIKGDKICNR